MKARIIVDSTADLVPRIIEHVHIVPLTVHFGEEEYIDGVTIAACQKTIIFKNNLPKYMRELGGEALLKYNRMPR